ncbi:MAG: hypothetical protein AAGC46_07440, partial [Solirubrobacteraceae bacterium]|nr:hypothetical protein [Patulibacter sp.]
MFPVRHLLALVLLVLGATTGTAAPARAAATVKAATAVSGTTISVKVTLRGSSAHGLVAVLQRRRGTAWRSVSRHTLARGKATLVWSGGAAKTPYRLRVIVLRGKRTVATGESKVVRTGSAPAPVVRKPVTTPSPRPTPTPAPPLPDHPTANTLSLSTTHSCAIDAAAHVTCWGAGAAGELGDGTTVDRGVPVQSAGGLQAISVGAGVGFTCAEATDETVWCWGDNADHQVPGLSASATTTPVQVPGLAHVQGLVVAGDATYACANRAAAAPVCWGRIGDLMPGGPAVLDAPSPLPGVGAAASVLSASATRLCVGDAAGVHCLGATTGPGAIVGAEQYPTGTTSVAAAALG